MKKILIFKLGHSETLDKRHSGVASLGDVLRTTFLLRYFKKAKVFWVVDKAAVPLLKRNRYIDEIFVYDEKTRMALAREKYDAILNFEKSPGICRFSDSLSAKCRFGFNGASGKAGGWFGGDESLVRLSADLRVRRRNQHCWQDILSKAIGKKWRGEEYVLGYDPSSKIKYDIGFNWTTSAKWKNKAWPKACWKRLERLLESTYSISWQKGLKNLYEYIEWINSCRLIVTADTLGLHIALALRKRVIALFGPTSPSEVYLYGLGRTVLPRVPYDCIPCLKLVCRKKNPCMEFISPEKVKDAIAHEFKKHSPSRNV